MSQLRRFSQWCRPRLWLLWVPFSLLWLELVVRVFSLHTFLGRGLLYIPLFSFGAGFLINFICSLLKPKACRRVSIVLLAMLTFWYMVQTVYCQVSTTFLTLYSVGNGAGPITQFWREILLGILHSLPALVLEVVPFVLLLWRGRRLFPQTEPTKHLCRRLFGGTACFYLIAFLLVTLSNSGLLTPHFLFFNTFIPELNVSNFGVLTTLGLDARSLVFGTKEEDPEATAEALPSSTADLNEDNVLDIDFTVLANEEENTTISALHTYFNSREPTSKNEYTGIFEGKNLIYITAESFAPYAISEELTPTLYKLANSGFEFENFYTPLWWVSTSDGEYVNCQSLIPKAGVWSLEQSGSNYLPFTLGNQFLNLDYTTYAFHDHYYNYYGRDISHPNMGYTYMARNFGLDMSDLFPESDVEMMQLSIPEYINDTPFHVYYMTVSGHMNYTFIGNDMAAKHEDEVADLDLSEEARAYLACNMELDRALENLIEQLDEAGILEDTVICLTPDHYPYGLDRSTINELVGHEVEDNFELYESTLILWSGDMTEPVKVTKPCSNLDILPTLSNLFGLEYDSRLMMGQDILSDSEGLVVFSNRSFITEHGSYNSKTDEFIPYDDVAVPASYAEGLMEQVNNMFSYSAAVLDNDYFSLLPLNNK